VDTERINFLLNHPSDATKDDVLLLEDAVSNYPYSQVLHILKAKIGDQLGSDDKNRLLTTAAIYSANRAVLKRVVQGDNYLENIKKAYVFQTLPIVELKEDEPQTQSESEKPGDSSTIFDEVIKNLQKLKSLREQFLFLESGGADDEDEKPKPKELKEKSLTEDSDKEQKKDKKKKKPASKEKKEKIDKLIEKDLELDTKVNEYFIAEISQKGETGPIEKTDKKVTQEEIIEKFIQEQPSIGSISKELAKSQEEITRDLSEKSTKFGDDLISENLAIILLKQGKKERAVDIYRKLIWKLPQKKAYFAARIEEIKK
jgi:tetratricopeptide (TPR) repeat protein